MPTTMISPKMVRLLRVMSKSGITMKVMSIAMGMPVEAKSALRQPKKTRRVRKTRMIPCKALELRAPIPFFTSIEPSLRTLMSALGTFFSNLAM